MNEAPAHRGLPGSSARKRVVVLLARAPSAKGKTRLTAGLSETRARSLREALFLDTLDRAGAAGVPVIVCFTPDDARDEMARLAGDVTLVAQRGDDLGARMRNAVADALALGAGQVALVGSDLPTLPPEYLADAFAMLASGADLVFGPAEDGGFYLMAVRAPLGQIFDGIAWSQRDVFDGVVAAAGRAGLRVGIARPWWDVDTPDDLRRAREAAASLPVPSRLAAWE